MRAIDADALKEQIRKGLGIKSFKYLLPAERYIVEKIDRMPTIYPEQHWIPITERLPKKQAKVLVVDFGEVDTAYLNSEGRWMDFNGDKLKDVKAWMPLPKWEGETNA